MSGLHIDRPCRVRRATRGRWEWTCLCSPDVWPCTGREATCEAALFAADSHLTTDHPAPQTEALAAVIDLATFRRPTAGMAGSGFGGEAA
jgi:hypothetical protein